MKKTILLLIFISSAINAIAPTSFNGELQSSAFSQNIRVPNFQTTAIGGVNRRLETGNDNELQNPNFEHSTVSSGWTVTNATSTANTTTQFEGLKSISLALSGALQLSQSSTVNAARKIGVQMVASAWVNSTTVADIQLCSLKNGAEDKCTAVGGYVPGSGWRQLTVSFIGDSTSNGVRVKTTTTSGTVLVDQAYVGLGSPIVDFAPDMVFRAKFSITGVTSEENTDFVNGNATISSTAIYTIPFNSGVFTVAPNCTATTSGTVYPATIRIENVSSTQVVVATKNYTNGYEAMAFNLVCQKQGADYKTSKAYVASSSDTDWASYTPTFTGFGTPTNVEFQWKKVGSDLKIRGKFSAGTSTAVEARVSLPNNLTSAGVTIIPSIQQVGTYAYGISSTNNHGGFVLIEPSVGYITFSGNNVFGSGSANPLTKINAGTLVVVGAGETISLFATIPIQGWTDPGVIVGSFQGMNETPGANRVEMFSVSYGTTSATTACSASPCSYMDQIGNAVSTVARGGAGSYTINTTKTYTKIKCSISCAISGGNGCTAPDIQAANTSAIPFVTVAANTGTTTNSYGSLICHGTY